MNGRGYSPQGYRPEPTTAPATGSPLSPRERPNIDAYADMSAQLEARQTFLKARAAATPVVEPLFYEALGYAKGYADACMEKRDIVGAVRKLEWMRNPSLRLTRTPRVAGCRADFSRPLRSPAEPTGPRACIPCSSARVPSVAVVVSRVADSRLRAASPHPPRDLPFGSRLA